MALPLLEKTVMGFQRKQYRKPYRNGVCRKPTHGPRLGFQDSDDYASETGRMGGEPQPKWRNLRSFGGLQNDALPSSDENFPNSFFPSTQEDIPRRTRDDESM